MLPFTSRLSRWPWWALVAALIGVLFVWQANTDEDYQVIFAAVRDGLSMTIFVTVVAFTFSMLVGLIVAFMRLSRNALIYQISTFYVEIIRGVPMLVLLLYVAFVIIPGVVDGVNALGRALVSLQFAPAPDNPFTAPLASLTTGIARTGETFFRVAASLGLPLAELRVRSISDVARVIIALVIGYSAFISEIFRAGIESIERGQMEAARSLGMSYRQAMQHVILPQAIRNVLPPLGNDFIAMLKDSSLVSVLGVRDITTIGRLYAASTFQIFKSFNVIAFLYLSMTLILSIIVRGIERRLGQGRR
ncbi:MAG: amino acid ABC transporter permease [Anaerolineae bacterium]|nr:amino acid ABC transporter permease [Anaerolineae bacterium]